MERNVREQIAQSPRSSPRGLATVALLKARLDEGIDHIDMFMPLIIDALANLTSNSFTAADAQISLQQRHGLAMPLHTITTLLKRATRKGLLRREAGIYVRLQRVRTSDDIQLKKKAIEEQHQLLAQAFRDFADKEEQKIESNEEALGLILGFLEDNKVDILLGTDESQWQQQKLTTRESRLVAEFARDLISSQSPLAAILNNILEGLVVQNTAFLTDITSPSRQLNRLRVFFDTTCLIEALGYEGPAQGALARETLQLLKASGAQCMAFDKTVSELQGILRALADRFATSAGKRSLRPSAMARYFLTNHYTAGDLRQMIALLKEELADIGIQIVTMPRRVPQSVLGEKELSQALADDLTHNEDEPRVVHDVDCVAAILTFRNGERFNSVADAKAVFATTSLKVITKVQEWYKEEGETGISPVIDIRALSNLAWLRRPALAGGLKLNELVVLCESALRPSRKTWERFLEHLDVLERSHVLTSDERVAIVVSEMTDDLLGDFENAADHPDAMSLDEVIERVRATYIPEANKQAAEQVIEVEQRLAAANARLAEIEANASARVSEYASQAERRVSEVSTQLSEAERREHTSAAEYRRLKLAVEGRALSVARFISASLIWILYAIVAVGAIVLIAEHPFHSNLVNIGIGVALMVFIGMEFLGIVHHIAQLKCKLEARLLVPARRYLGADEASKAGWRSVLGLDSPPKRASENEVEISKT